MEPMQYRLPCRGCQTLKGPYMNGFVFVIGTAAGPPPPGSNKRVAAAPPLARFLRSFPTFRRGVELLCCKKRAKGGAA